MEGGAGHSIVEVVAIGRRCLQRGLEILVEEVVVVYTGRLDLYSLHLVVAGILSLMVDVLTLVAFTLGLKLVGSLLRQGGEGLLLMGRRLFLLTEGSPFNGCLGLLTADLRLLIVIARFKTFNLLQHFGGHFVVLNARSVILATYLNVVVVGVLVVGAD